MRNPDSFPAESNADLLRLREQYATPASMAEDFANGVVSWAEVTERFPDERDHELVDYLAQQPVESEGVVTEDEADERLVELLEEPENGFLQLPKNMELIDSADTAVEALAVAEAKIAEREARTFRFEGLRQMEGIKMVEGSVEGVRKTIAAIEAGQVEIGRGGDAYVVVYRGELEHLPPEVCYKFAIEETTKRGRNSVAQEAEIHTHFFDAVKELSESKFAVPMPYYATEVGNKQLIAMEKLPAKSVDDILRGLGTLPEWVDIDVFCDELTALLDHLHEKGLYHRDMHEGNVMVRQTPEEPTDGKWGYLIDFGLSGYGVEGMDPYAKEVAGTRFTYNDDHGIVKTIRQKLTQLRQQRSQK